MAGIDRLMAWNMQKAVTRSSGDIRPQQMVFYLAESYPERVTARKLMQDYGVRFTEGHHVTEFVEFIHVWKHVNANLRALGWQVSRDGGQIHNKYWLQPITGISRGMT